jgi:hypothetical protein
MQTFNKIFGEHFFLTKEDLGIEEETKIPIHLEDEGKFEDDKGREWEDGVKQVEQ